MIIHRTLLILVFVYQQSVLRIKTATMEKNAFQGLAKKRDAPQIRVQTRNIRPALLTEPVNISASVPHLHAVAVTNAKQLIPGLRMFQTIPIPVYAKYYRQKLVQRTKIVRRKRNVVTDTASSATPVQKTAIALLQNGAAIMDTVS